MLSEFKKTISEGKLPHALSIELQSLWYAGAGDWERSHNLVDQLPGKAAAWVHAYLHRVEGDNWNANYWYDRAGQPMPTDTEVEEEWEALSIYFLSI